MITRAVVIPAITATVITTTGFGDPVFVENEGADVLYIGGDATVTNANGFPVQVVPSILSRIDLKDYAGKIYGYSVAGCTVRIIENFLG